jgi:malate dehydrogenase
LLWMVARGDCFGPDQPVILQLLEITPAMEKLNGTVMELQDSAFPLVQGIVASDDPKVAFAGADAIFLVGSLPRKDGMQRSDLIKANGPIFVGQGQAIGAVASKDVRVLVVGNPCNTNAYIAMRSASGLAADRFTAMTRLDHNRAVGQLAAKKGVSAASIRDVAVWGNHSDRMYPDVTGATLGGEAVTGQFEQEWLRGDFMSTVAKRGAAIIKARGLSSAASAASAAVDHMRDWFLGTDQVVSMAVPSKGEYGVPEGLIFSFPCRCKGGNYEVITDWKLDDFAKQKIAENVAELESERAAVADLLG